jgi:hypothetical protein
MIDKKAALASIGLADHFSDKGFVVSAAPNTVLSELVRLSNNELVSVMGERNSTSESDIMPYEMLAENLAMFTQGSLEEPSLHDQCLDSVVTDISKAISVHISYAKNVVAPTVLAFKDSIQSELDKLQHLDPSSEFNIEVADIPDILKDKTFTSILSRYASKTPIPPETILNINNKNLDDILALLPYGEAETDTLIQKWINTKNQEFYLKVWNSFFGYNEHIEYYQVEDTLNLDVYESCDVGLALYLIANKLYNSDPQMDTIPLADYQNRLAQIRDFGGALVQKALAKSDLTERNKIMVLQLLPEKKLCKVAGHLYRDWLAKDGRPEYILGMLISGNRYLTADAIDENKDQLLEQWTSYVTYYNAAENNKKFSLLKDTLELTFNNMLNDLSEEEKEFELNNPAYRTNIAKYLKEELSHLKMQDLTDINKLALKLIARVRFYYTSSYKILSAIEQASIVNPNIEVREAALLATVEYVVDYIAEQMSLQPH